MGTHPCPTIASSPTGRHPTMVPRGRVLSRPTVSRPCRPCKAPRNHPMDLDIAREKVSGDFGTLFCVLAVRVLVTGEVSPEKGC